jgi:hypothetical protein
LSALDSEQTVGCARGTGGFDSGYTHALTLQSDRVATWQGHTTGLSRTNRTRSRTARGVHLLVSTLVEAADRRSLIYDAFSLTKCVDPTNSRFSRGIRLLHLLIFSATTYNAARTARRALSAVLPRALYYTFLATRVRARVQQKNDGGCDFTLAWHLVEQHHVEDWGAGSNSPVLGIARGTRLTTPVT